MSATSEELAAQAEQLQAAIAFFQTDRKVAAPAAAQYRPMRAAPMHAAPMHAVIEKRPSVRHSPVRRTAGNGHDPGAGKPGASKAANGYALNLAGGDEDTHDAEFVRY